MQFFVLFGNTYCTFTSLFAMSKQIMLIHLLVDYCFLHKQTIQELFFVLEKLWLLGVFWVGKSVYILFKMKLQFFVKLDKEERELLRRKIIYQTTITNTQVTKTNANCNVWSEMANEPLNIQLSPLNLYIYYCPSLEPWSGLYTWCFGWGCTEFPGQSGTPRSSGSLDIRAEMSTRVDFFGYLFD